MSDDSISPTPSFVRAIVIGRHALDFGDERIEVLEQRNITFPDTAQACVPVLDKLLGEARRSQARLLFQAVPAQVAAALLKMRDSDTNSAATNELNRSSLGFVINKPGLREAGVTRAFHGLAQTVAEVAHFANPNVKVNAIGNETGNNVIGVDEIVTVTVDPPMKFVFSHIEWLTL